jgi:cell division protein FtsB
MIYILIALLALTVPVMSQSDFQIAKEFKAKQDALVKQAEGVSTPEQAEQLRKKVEALDHEYAPFKDRINNVLAPDSYDARFKILDERLQLTGNWAGRADSLAQRVASLEVDVVRLSAAVDSLTESNSKMFSEIGRLQNELANNRKIMDSLNNVIKQLRTGLAKRDQMIFAMVDSIFIQAGKNVDAMTDKEKRGVGSKLDQRNMFANIRKAISENLQFISVTALTPHDYAALVPEQRKFASQWKGLGPKLASIYLTGKDQKKQVAIVDTMIASWGKQLDASAWQSLSQVLFKHNVIGAPIVSGDDFVLKLNAYVDGQIAIIEQKKEGDHAKVYSAFADSVWAPIIKVSWKPVLIQCFGVSEDQFKQLDVKVEKWAALALPGIGLWLYIVGILILGVLIFLLLRAGKKKAPVPTPQSTP